MDLTLREQKEIEAWRRTAYIIARGMDAGLHRIPASEGELSLVRNAAQEMSGLIIDLSRHLEPGPRRVTSDSVSIVQLGLRFLDYPVKTDAVVQRLISIATFLSSIVADDQTQDQSEQETRVFLEEFHEFLFRKVLQGNLPEPRVTSLGAAHG